MLRASTTESYVEGEDAEAELTEADGGGEAGRGGQSLRALRPRGH